MVGGSQRGSQKSWAAKVRTGCLTCKKRRIKCDEGKPSCLRCIKHKVRCEGYFDTTNQSSTFYAHNAKSTEWAILTPKIMTSMTEVRWKNLDSKSPSNDSFSSGGTGSKSSFNSSDQESSGQGEIVSHYHTQQTITAWTESFSPYQTSEQRSAMKSWMELAPSMGRSQQGLKFWTVLIPTLAWTNAPVRNAMMAVSLITLSLRRKDDSLQSTAIGVDALRYANKCIRELIDTPNPPEAVIASSSLFWIFEMCIGNWSNSMLHLAAGNRIAKNTKLSQMSDPLAAQYVRSFVGDFPASIHPEAISSMSKQEQKAQSTARHHYAIFIMRDALERLHMFQQRLDVTHSPHKDRAIQMVSRTARELQRLCEQWPIPVEVDENPAVILRAIRAHSPFLSIIDAAESFFEDDDLAYIAKFETQFRPCIDQFMWLAACFHLDHRQKIIEIWNVKRTPLPLTDRLLSTAEIDPE